MVELPFTTAWLSRFQRTVVSGQIVTDCSYGFSPAAMRRAMVFPWPPSIAYAVRPGALRRTAASKPDAAALNVTRNVVLRVLASMRSMAILGLSVFELASACERCFSAVWAAGFPQGVRISRCLFCVLVILVMRACSQFGRGGPRI